MNTPSQQTDEARAREVLAQVFESAGDQHGADCIRDAPAKAAAREAYALPLHYDKTIAAMLAFANDRPPVDREAIAWVDLTAKLSLLHEAAKGCEFDLVPADGAIAQLALFMHEHGDLVIAALSLGTAPCLECRGRGEVCRYNGQDPASPTVDCERCAGTGAAPKPTASIEDGVTTSPPNKLVPVEPTEAMLQAGADNLFGAASDDWKDDARGVWAAMLAASPVVPDGREAIRAAIINTPETADFMAGVPIEAAHQRDRWGSAHDAGKTPEDWFWLIGYLAQKALRAQNAGDDEKAKHHTISTAAALANWHAALTGADASMRPGIAPPVSS